jgi:predicted metalloprotease with PDZ domain
MRPFFDRYVRSGHPIDFDRYLGLIGLRARVTWGPALGRDAKPLPDLRMWSWLPPGDSTVSLLLGNAVSAWSRAGLHTGDRLLRLDGKPMVAAGDLRGKLSGLAIGDTVRLEVRRSSGVFRAAVPITGYERPFVTIEELPGATTAQRTLRAQWLAGR